MSVTGAYARYSPGKGQGETSIEDQLRRCRQVAEREGLSIDEKFVFADEAITGKAEGLAKRTQYRRLLDAIEARECSIVIVDEISRLTRHVREGGRLMDLVDEMGVRFLTNDGIDTQRDGWRPLWMVKLMAANMEVESTGTRHAVMVDDGRIRRLTPEELEELNGFPRGFTAIEGLSGSQRAFLMGNALVCGVVTRIAVSLAG